MPDIINPFDEAGFDLATMTKGLNILPNNYGRIGQLGLFNIEGVTQRTVIFDEENGVLNLLSPQPWGAPAQENRRGGRKQRSFAIPHLPLHDRILPGDFQGVREFDQPDSAKTLNSAMSKTLGSMRNKFAITTEHLEAGALKGIILDADGNTIFNLYTQFGITAKTISFALSTSTTNVTAKCRLVLRHIEDNLKGEVMTGVRCLCGETFFDSLISHDNVEKFFLNHAKALDMAGTGVDPRKGFAFGGVIFEEYRGTATNAAGDAVPFIGASDAHFYPVGTMETFVIYYAPADYIETVNTKGLEHYAKQTMDSRGRWVDVDAQSNPLPLCRRPGLLVKGTA